MMLDLVATCFEVDFKVAMSSEACENVTSRDDPSRFSLIIIIEKCYCNLSIYTCESDREGMSVV